MYKDLIKKYLGSDIKEAKVPGITTTDKAKKESKAENQKYYKDTAEKFAELEKDSAKEDSNAIKPVMRDYTDSEKEFHDDYETLNGMEMLRYDGVVEDKFKERQEMAIKGDPKMGNDIKTGKWNPKTGEGNGNTEPVWGASDVEFGKKLVDRIRRSVKKRNDATKALYQFGDDIEVAAGDPRISHRDVAVESTTPNNNENKKSNINENKMKRLKFIKPLNGSNNALKLIPKDYKVNNNVFEMTDGNETYKIRWEDGKPVILEAKNQTKINEDINRMKELFNYNSREIFGVLKGYERIKENDAFIGMINKSKALITEEEQTNSDIKSECSDTPVNIRKKKVAEEAENEDGWPKELKKGRFTEWCKRNGFENGASISCAKKAMASDDSSVRGMAIFYMNTVKPNGKTAADLKEGIDTIKTEKFTAQKIGDNYLIHTNITGKDELITVPVDFFENLLKDLGLKIKDLKIQTREGEDIDEKAVSKAQQRFMGMVHAAQKGENPASPEVAKVAASMDKKDVEDFASTKHKGLPEKVDNTNETTVAGAAADGGSSGPFVGKLKMESGEETDLDIEVNDIDKISKEPKIKVNEKNNEVEIENIGKFKLEFDNDKKNDWVSVKVTLDGEETNLQGVKYKTDGVWIFGNDNFEITQEDKNPYKALVRLVYDLY